LVAVLAAASVVAFSTAAFADSSTGISTDFFNVNGVNGSITVNQGVNNVGSGTLQLSAFDTGGAHGPAGTTTRTLNNGNTITFNPSGSTSGSSSPSAGGPATSQQFNTGSLSYLDPGSYTLNASGTAFATQTNNGTVIAGDGPFGVSAAINVSRTITVNNLAPSISTALQNGTNGNITVPQGSTVALQMQATDPGRDGINFTIDGGGAGSVGQLANVNASSGATRTSSVVNQSYYAVGTFTNTFDAQDQYGANATQASRQVTVTNVAPSSLVLHPSATTVNEGQSISTFATATDPGSDNLTFTVDSQNAGTISGAPGSTRTSNSVNTGPFSQTGGASSTYNLTGSVSDGNGGSASTALSITVLNLPPVIVSIGEDAARVHVPLMFLGGDLVSVAVNATDPGNDTLTYAFQVDGGGYGAYTASNSTGPLYYGVGTHTVDFIVNDQDTGLTPASYTFEVVPEPATLALAGLGGAFALALFRRKRKK